MVKFAPTCSVNRQTSSPRSHWACSQKGNVKVAFLWLLMAWFPAVFLGCTHDHDGGSHSSRRVEKSQDDVHFDALEKVRHLQRINKSVYEIYLDRATGLSVDYHQGSRMDIKDKIYVQVRKGVLPDRYVNYQKHTAYVGTHNGMTSYRATDGMISRYGLFVFKGEDDDTVYVEGYTTRANSEHHLADRSFRSYCYVEYLYFASDPPMHKEIAHKVASWLQAIN